MGDKIFLAKSLIVCQLINNEPIKIKKMISGGLNGRIGGYLL